MKDQVNSERNDRVENQQNHMFLRQNGKMSQHRSYTHRVRENIPTPIESCQNKKFSLQYHSN